MVLRGWEGVGDEGVGRKMVGSEGTGVRQSDVGAKARVRTRVRTSRGE